MRSEADRLKEIRARVQSVSLSRMSKLPKPLQIILSTDIPWLLDMLTPLPERVEVENE